MKNENLLDQFFLVDEEVVEKLVAAAFINKTDWVLEIGAGRGIITKEVAKKAGKVWAIEIDKSFQDELKKMPGKVEVIYANALEVLEKKLKFNKIVGSLPSSLVEPLIRRLIKLKFELAVFLVPLKFVDNLLNNEILTIYLETRLLEKVSKTAFNPQPKTNWSLVRIVRRPSPLSAADYERFIRQYLYEHPEAKLKNALTEAAIQVYRRQGKTLTKNQAREIVSRLPLSSEEKESLVAKENFSRFSHLFSSALFT